MSAPRKPILSTRAQHLFKTLVQCYIQDGQPVGSRRLAGAAGLDLSAATIRHVMADLEDLGFIQSPHTSAGRVPTVRGYRLFVDNLLTISPVDSGALLKLRNLLEPHTSAEDLAASASVLLSEISRLAGVVTLPKREYAALRHVEFLPLSEQRVLAILVINKHEVQNRIIHTERRYTAAELQQASNYLNAQFSGKDINAVRTGLLRELRSTRLRLDKAMQTVIDVAEQCFSPSTVSAGLVMAGQANLMDFAELSHVDKLRSLFQAFNEKRELLHLLDECVQAEGIQIFIGDESGYKVLGECSLVTAPYTVDGQVLGVLGVIGPTRMAYERVIPIVDMTARLMAAALNVRH